MCCLLFGEVRIWKNCALGLERCGPRPRGLKQNSVSANIFKIRKTKGYAAMIVSDLPDIFIKYKIAGGKNCGSRFSTLYGHHHSLLPFVNVHLKKTLLNLLTNPLEQKFSKTAKIKFLVAHLTFYVFFVA